MSDMQKRENNLVATIINVNAAVLLLFFVHTMLYTWKQLASFKNMLAFYTYEKTLIAWTVISVELIIAVMLFLPRTRKIGFILASVFGMTAIIIMRTYPGVPHDFGGVINHISHPMRYAVFSLVTLLGISGLILSLRKKTPVREADNVPVVYT
jgi:uncharacterized membrane protein YphA (DoxX/SURF4 family)